MTAVEEFVADLEEGLKFNTSVLRDAQHFLDSAPTPPNSSLNEDDFDEGDGEGDDEWRIPDAM
jgi:hypothetical protein